MDSTATQTDVIEWLLDSDPAIRWQVLRDLIDAPAHEVAAERAKVATEGWGARLLARQRPDGTWPSDPGNEEWTSSPEGTAFVSLLWLRDLGLDPASPEAARAVTLVRDNVAWHWWDDNPFFVGEVEPCINGRVVALGAYSGQDVTGLVDRLLGEQMADGGWNCEQERGATVGSFSTTINVLEGLAEYERAVGATQGVTAARRRGEDYLLERRLLRRLSTGEIADPIFTELSFPPNWHYDVLRALDYFRSVGTQADERMSEAIDVVQQKRGEAGRWLLENPIAGFSDIGTGEVEGQPSRWISLHAMRVLRWSGLT
jgi:hypothetical protein